MGNVREAQSDNICEKSVESLTIMKMLTLLRAKYNLRVLRSNFEDTGSDKENYGLLKFSCCALVRPIELRNNV